MTVRPLFNSRIHCLIVLYPSEDSEASYSRALRILDARFHRLSSLLMYAVCSSRVSVNASSSMTLQ